MISTVADIKIFDTTSHRKTPIKNTIKKDIPLWELGDEIEEALKTYHFSDLIITLRLSSKE